MPTAIDNRLEASPIVNMERETMLRKGNMTENFRFITLFNTKPKILAKMLAKLLGIFISSIVKNAQTCTIRGRSIHGCLHLIRITDRE